jgi:nitroreductase
METWAAITSRKNVRDYSDEPLASADVDRVLEAGAGHVARSQATVAVVAPIPEDDSRARMIEYDLGQMTMQLMIAAADLGIGTAHAFVQDQDVARAVLGHPEDKRCAWLITMGYPADGPLRPIEKLNRRSFDDVVHRDRF